MISPFLTRAIKRSRRNSPANDPQRSRLYALEREFVGSAIYHSVSRQNLQTVADHACRYYRIEPIRIRVYHKEDERVFGNSYYYQHGDGRVESIEIALNRAFHGANLTTLLHELAHYICDNTYANRAGHGPEFCGIYMHLLDQYRILPALAFRALAEKHKVTVARRFRPAAIRG